MPVTDASDIFDSDFVSDCTVKCGDRVWKLHRVILCSRSHFFRAALMGNFKEAQDNEVVLREQDPELVEHALRFIYSGNINRIKCLDRQDLDDTSLDAIRVCLGLYKLGDFLNLAKLCGTAVDKLERYMKMKAEIVQRTLHDDAKLPVGFIPRFVELAKQAYNIPKNDRAKLEGNIRHPFIHFFTFIRFRLVEHPEFLTALQAVPELLADILWQFGRIDRLNGPERGDHCFQCGRDPFKLNTYDLDGVGIWMVKGECYTCWSRLNGDITALGEVGEDDLN
ncbi:BTB/POZ protein [Cercophora newfieldiana]|uniref:BTB/POZ protein n=1 Tax=Cercophora newfieldiana TaxID=92897 RepID=A0AA39YLA1_9PEZI|nr:BTB/POZ protein [Cercophora newfieldiana]